MCVGGGGGGITSYIWHTSTDVRAELPLFSGTAKYMPPFFNKKYMTDPICLD